MFDGKVVPCLCKSFILFLLLFKLVESLEQLKIVCKYIKTVKQKECISHEPGKDPVFASEWNIYEECEENDSDLIVATNEAEATEVVIEDISTVSTNKTALDIRSWKIIGAKDMKFIQKESREYFQT